MVFMSDPNEYLPVAQFSFILIEGEKTALHQLWVTPFGQSEWRPVPTIELGKQRKPAVAGYLEDDDDVHQ